MSKEIKPIDALEAIDRIHNNCEEIDYHLPEEEQTGYLMIKDVLLIRRFIYQQINKERFRLF